MDREAQRRLSKRLVDDMFGDDDAGHMLPEGEDHVEADETGGGKGDAVVLRVGAENRGRRRQEGGHGDHDEEPVFGADSFTAIMLPVMVTMCISAAVVVNIRSPITEQIGEGLSMYIPTGLQPTSSDSSETSFLKSAGWALIAVSVICAMTFVIVLCYKYDCICFLQGYVLFSATMLLGYMGGLAVYVALDIYGVVVDLPSFIFIMWNFAIVGTTSIFYQHGINRAVTKSYLIAASIIMAFLISQFNYVGDWVVWCLLGALALYDLCAVLTPCGPLKALISVMQAKEEAAEEKGEAAGGSNKVMQFLLFDAASEDENEIIERELKRSANKEKRAERHARMEENLEKRSKAEASASFREVLHKAEEGGYFADLAKDSAMYKLKYAHLLDMHIGKNTTMTSQSRLPAEVEMNSATATRSGHAEGSQPRPRPPPPRPPSGMQQRPPPEHLPRGKALCSWPLALSSSQWGWG
eukprot:g3006.t1